MENYLAVRYAVVFYKRRHVLLKYKKNILKYSIRVQKSKEEYSMQSLAIKYFLKHISETKTQFFNMQAKYFFIYFRKL